MYIFGIYLTSIIIWLKNVKILFFLSLFQVEEFIFSFKDRDTVWRWCQ